MVKPWYFLEKVHIEYALFGVYCGRMALNGQVCRTLSAFVAGSRVHVWEASESVPVASVVYVLLSVPSVGF